MYAVAKFRWLIVVTGYSAFVVFVAARASGPPQLYFDDQPLHNLLDVGSETFGYSTLNNNGFTPIDTLSMLSETNFTQLQHPMFPKHRVRIKKTRFCDKTVNSYTGYIDVGARHLFFYFFESRSNPDKDDIIYWTNGGPGAASSLGLFMELGPCRILDSEGPKYHPHSWNSNANLLSIEQPIGVGFSYSDYGETVETSEDAAKDMAAFLAIFFEHFTQFKGRALHMAGESYGGIYIPTFAAEVYDQNTQLIQSGLTPINLTSIMIGNGMTDFYAMMPAYYDMACTLAGGRSPSLDISTCIRMKQTMPRCKKWMKDSCVDKFDSIDCGAAIDFCEAEMEVPLGETGFNPYDLTKKCDESGEIPCYPEASHISAYLNLPSTRALLGVSPSFTANFSLVSWDVNSAFEVHQDMFRSRVPLVSALLERGVKALVYVGTNDFSCNWLGNERWTLDMEWSGQSEFAQQDLREWVGKKNVTGRSAGMVRSANGLTFVTVEGAGHMVPYDKPQEALELVTRWLSGDDFKMSSSTFK